ncbi:MAG TPA: hypothetical protein VKZ95_01385, partial [Sphingobacteriaceae bacterium]|nr:hypothetical protein [Sphingobacteriaceae bacterium]
RESFQIQPIATADDGGGATTGATGDVNLLLFPHSMFEYAILGAGQTIKTPVFTSAGLNIAGDQVATEGFELTNGITTRCAQKCVIGTNVARIVVRFNIADASGTSPFFLGYRKVQAYATALATYTDFAGFNLVSGTLNVSRQTATGGVVSTDSGVTVADNDYVQIQVDIGKGGICQFRAIASAVQPTATDLTKVVAPLNIGYTFTSGLEVIPSIFMLQGADLSGDINMTYYEAGNLV